MLEKTAASLEPCGLQRVLPAANTSLRSRRQLHTAFWQHGAANIELSNAWQVLMHGVFDASMDSALADAASSSMASDLRYPALRASSFLLDFLYPTGTVAFMRRFSPVNSDRLEILRPASTFAKVSPRLYSSSTHDREDERSDLGQFDHIQEQANVTPDTEGIFQREGVETKLHDHAVDGRPGTFRNGSNTGTSSYKAEDDKTISDGGPHAPQLVRNTNGEEAKHVSELRSLLMSDAAGDADKVWYHYASLDKQSKRQYLGQTLVFLSKTGRVTDSWKISELFNQLEPNDWDNYSFKAGLEAEVDLQNHQQARDIFARGIDHSEIDDASLVDAFDLMLATALKSSTRDPLYQLWKLYEKISTRLDLTGGITAQLLRVASVAGLGDIVLGLKFFFKGAKGGKGLVGLMHLKKLLVRRALMVCPNHQVMELLRMTNEQLAYEEVIRSSNDTMPQRKSLIIPVYKLYRDDGRLRTSSPSHAVLHTVFGAFKDLGNRDSRLSGLEMVWGDWFTYHEKPTRRAYQKFMAFYASIGDKKRVYRLWKDQLETYGELVILTGGDTFSHLLKVNAVRQDVSEAQRIFDDISTKFHQKPNKYCWSILLSAYVKAGDYDGAISTFEKLCVDLGGMDTVSVGTLMQMAAERGDLGFTLELYRRARRQHVHTNSVPILCSLIDAYCQNDLFTEAEDLCVRAAAKELKEPRMWNNILRAYSVRGNLVGINKLLNRMTELEVPYNSYTYKELLHGLARCKQPQHALHLLAVGIQDGAFEVTEEHFHIVMGAFIKSGEGDVAVKVHKLMQQCGFRESADSLIQLTTAFNQWSRLPHKRGKGQPQQVLINAALRRFYKNYGIRDAKGVLEGKGETTPRSSPGRNTLRPGKAADHFSRMIYIFTQMRDYAQVQELIDMYHYVVQDGTRSRDALPVKMLNSIMWADLAEKKYDTLEGTWQIMFKMAQEDALSPEWSDQLHHTRKVSPRYRYVLNDGIKVMQTKYIEDGDATSLQKLFVDVREAGFEIDSRNWNLHVQGLIQCQSYKQAFYICEKWLMPNWTGWMRARQKAPMKNAVPLDLRRRGEWPRHLRPISHTLYYLAKGWMDLDKMAPWSGDAGRTLSSIKADCPRCYRAIVSMVRAGSPLERQILGDDAARLPAAEEGAEEDGGVPGDEMAYIEFDGSAVDADNVADEDMSVPITERISPV